MPAVKVLACLPASVRARPPCLSLHRSPLSFASSSVPRARLSPPLHVHVGFRRGWRPTQRDRTRIHGLASAVRGPVLRGFPCSRTASPAPRSRCLSTVSESRKPSGVARRPSTRSSSPCGRRASASVGRKNRPQLLLLVYSCSFSFDVLSTPKLSCSSGADQRKAGESRKRALHLPAFPYLSKSS